MIENTPERANESRSANRLAGETSPYLRQHAHNPVDWYPWGDEAIAHARSEDKPIFLSIGYAACHWCHVMERESFENDEIAALMNDLYVNMKVDREERPDLDHVYMTAVQMMTGSGGWPMSVFLTPELTPFYGGTYFPPDDRYGRPGFPRVLRAAAEAFRLRRTDVEATASEIARRIGSVAEFPDSGAVLGPAILRDAADRIAQSFDPKFGGFGRAPKFPHGMVIQALLRDSRLRGSIQSLGIARTTLDRMAAGGIYDHVGGGFHRYSTDERWLVPHFEKMLYDNVLLAVAYLEGFQVTRDEAYARVAGEIFRYLEREMTSPEGGLYSTQDADSDGHEGLFYTWTPAELAAVLGPEDADLVARAYDVDDVGNFEGRSILHPVKDDVDLARSLGLEPAAVRARLASARERLYEAREMRTKPLRDEKVLADWNALAITALARGSRVLGDPALLERGRAAARFVLDAMADPDGAGAILHVWKDGTARIPGFLEDHAGMLVALLDLFEASGDVAWLRAAERMRDVILRDFAREDGAGFHDTSARHAHLIARTRRPDDGAVPSGNALAAHGFLRLGRMLGRDADLRTGEAILRAFVPAIEMMPTGMGMMMAALDLHLSEPQEIVVVGPAAGGRTRELRAAIDRAFLPHAVVLQGTGSDTLGIAGLEGKTLPDGMEAAVYICSGFSCKAPVGTVETLEPQLR